jgi:hypothetical protein
MPLILYTIFRHSRKAINVYNLADNVVEVGRVVKMHEHSRQLLATFKVHITSSNTILVFGLPSQPVAVEWMKAFR